MRVAGLAKVENVPRVENFDCTKWVNGHMAYRTAMPTLLQEVGWEVESLEFTEIEDPDPENHEKRQRELIQELEDARKDAEEKSLKKRFNFFNRSTKKKNDKKGWETYDERSKETGTDDFSTSAAEGQAGNILFDIEAIKRELESEAIEVRQLESTMPPMKLNANGTVKETETEGNPRDNLRSTKSYDDSMPYRLKAEETTSSHVSLPNNQTLTPSQKNNPFNKGYDEYNLSAEALNGTHSVTKQEEPSLSFEAPKQSPSPRQDSFTPRDVSATPAPSRPSLSTSMSSPTSTAGFDSLDHNAWVDEDDPQFGREQDVQLTF